MVAGTRTWAMEETVLGPHALQPPPLRHALFVLLIGLTAVLHLGSAGWDDIHNGAEGFYASSARQMIEQGAALTPSDDGIVAPEQPPLFLWLLRASYKLIGLTRFATHLPVALATIGSVALTFLIGERLSGYWRGFNAGLIQLCSCATFTWSRLATPGPVFVALAEAALFCLVCGYQQPRNRRWWFAATWIFTAFAVLTEGAFALFFLAAVVFPSALPFRAARMRFRGLLHWSGLAAFAAVIGPWLFWLALHPNGPRGGLPHSAWWLPFVNAESVAAASSPAWLFLVPWLPVGLLVLPAVCFGWRKILRPHEFDWNDALPLSWMAMGFITTLLLQRQQDHYAILLSPGLALSAACIWERTNARLRNAGVLLTAAICLVVATRYFFVTPPGSRAPMQFGALAVTLLALAFGAYLSWRGREQLALIVILLGLLTIGLTAAEAIAQRGAQFSFASIAPLVQPRAAGEPSDVLFEGTPAAGSSLSFYLGHPPVFVDSSARESNVDPAAQQSLSLAAAIDRFGAAHSVYLIAPKERVNFWQEQLTARYHIYHQVSACGEHVVMVNQP